MIGEFKEYTPEELNHLHKVDLMILKDVVKVLDKHNIPYFLYAGSLLGAVRHGGFIPWDDDIDIAMFREDYDKAIPILVRELDKDKYDILEPTIQEDCFYSFAKISLKGTKFSLWYRDYVSFNVGIHIDIFPFDNVPDGNLKAKWYNFKTQILNHLMTNSVLKIEHSKVHRLIHYLLKILPVSSKSWKNRFYKANTKYNNQKTRRVTEFLIQPGFIAFDRADLTAGDKMKFEDEEFTVPQNWDKHLTEYFGDYMRLPPEEDRYNGAPLELDFGKY